MWVELKVLVLLYLIQISYMDNISLEQPPGIYNLTVEAFSQEIHDYPSIQLNISWTSVGIKDGLYNIKVRNVCPEKYCYYLRLGLNLSTTQWLVPEDRGHLIEFPECVIDHLCTYLVKVSSAHSEYSNVTEYTVPECVGDICSCQHRSMLPNITLSLNQTVDTVQINWEIISDDKSLFNSLSRIDTNKTIGLLSDEDDDSFDDTDYDGQMIPMNNLPADVTVDGIVFRKMVQTYPSKRWEYDGQELHLPLEVREGHIVLNGTTVFNITRGKNYTIQCRTTDSRGCGGPETNITFRLPLIQNNEADLKTDTRLIALYGFCIFAFVVFSIMIAKWFFRRMCPPKKHAEWISTYHSTTNGGRNISRIPMQQNQIYIDKDILEARECGNADNLEIPHYCLTIGHEIGKGAFGRVFVARADNLDGRGGSQVVAVKQLKKKPTSEEKEEFESEISTMKRVGCHPNVIQLLGCCTIKEPLLMVMEYAGCGDLLNYLRRIRSAHESRVSFLTNSTRPLLWNQLSQNHTPNGQMHQLSKYLEILHSSSSGTASTSDSSYVTQTDARALRPSLAETTYTMLSHTPDISNINSVNSLEYVLDHNELQNFAVQIARGMKHLEECKITHRDLAARNVLIDDTKTLKISDFGLSRNGIYVNTKKKKLPIRWLALECLKDNIYSSESDVWAFGILLWEIGTLGAFPYPAVSNHELIPFLNANKRLEKPENCSDQLYDIMLRCWQENPKDRPTFAELVQILEPSHQRIYIDFNELSADYVFPPTKEQLDNNNIKK